MNNFNLDELFKVELCSEHGASDYECIVDLVPLGSYKVLTIYYLQVPYEETTENMYITEICIEEI